MSNKIQHQTATVFHRLEATRLVFRIKAAVAFILNKSRAAYIWGFHFYLRRKKLGKRSADSIWRKNKQNKSSQKNINNFDCFIVMKDQWIDLTVVECNIEYEKCSPQIKAAACIWVYVELGFSIFHFSIF